MQSAAALADHGADRGRDRTGKELVARGIHSASPRAGAPFVAINCAAIPETLLESELFGHRRGAFTGRRRISAGSSRRRTRARCSWTRSARCRLPCRRKLLRVLQESEVVPVGDRRPRRIDVRVISATNRDLAADVARGPFRQDLFYRLGAFRSACRRCANDARRAAPRRSLPAEAAERHGKASPGWHRPRSTCWSASPGPGTSASCRTRSSAAVALAAAGRGDRPQHSPPSWGPSRRRRSGSGRVRTRAGPAAAARTRSRRATSRPSCAGTPANVTRAAEALGLSRFMLQKKMKEYGLREGRWSITRTRGRS